MKGLQTILLLILSNAFMTLAWYGHLRFKPFRWVEALGLLGIILLSWSIAFFEYCFQVPANRIGYKAQGGPYDLVQLKVIQEVISLTVFAAFTLVFFKQESLKWNHLAAFTCLVMAVYFVFRK
jgi:uncharacterized protein